MKRVRERRMRAKGGDPISQTATFDFLKDRAGLGYALELFLALQRRQRSVNGRNIVDLDAFVPHSPIDDMPHQRPRPLHRLCNATP